MLAVELVQGAYMLVGLGDGNDEGVMLEAGHRFSFIRLYKKVPVLVLFTWYFRQPGTFNLILF